SDSSGSFGPAFGGNGLGILGGGGDSHSSGDGGANPGIAHIASVSSQNNNSLRPDFYQVSGAFPSLTSYAGGQISLAITLNPFRAYLGIGPSGGYPQNAGVNITANYLVTKDPPTAELVDKVLT